MNSNNKKRKIEQIRSTLKSQVNERKKVKQQELEEKIKFDKLVEKTVMDDKRENDRIKLEMKKKIIREKELRDEQLYFKQRKDQMDKNIVK